MINTPAPPTSDILPGMMTMETFIRRFDEQPFEFDAATSQEQIIVPNVMGHIRLNKFFFNAFNKREETIGDVVVFSEAPYVLTYASTWVSGARVPDVMVFNAQRFGAYMAEHPDWERKPALIVPDLVIEIRSEHDTLTEMEDKADRCLADGVRVVWNVDPQKKRVLVYTQGGSVVYRLGVEDTLEGGEIAPGFTLAVAALFPAG